MHKHADLIHTFYQSFAKGNVEGMLQCYHDSIRFEDPAFGVLYGNEVRRMWRLLVRPGIKITYDNVQATDLKGSADWKAEYQFGPKKRHVINRIHAEFEFADGKIVRHTDHFDLWKWTRQALGAPGVLFGWSKGFQKKVKENALRRLAEFNQ